MPDYDLLYFGGIVNPCQYKGYKQKRQVGMRDGEVWNKYFTDEAWRVQFLADLRAEILSNDVMPIIDQLSDKHAVRWLAIVSKEFNRLLGRDKAGALALVKSLRGG